MLHLDLTIIIISNNNNNNNLFIYSVLFNMLGDKESYNNK